MSTPPPKIHAYPSSQEVELRQQLLADFKHCPIPDKERLANLGLFLNRPTLSRLLFLHELYQHILPVHGVIMEFGVRWGQSLAVFSCLRGIYEPYNYNRKIIGFDTFSGFPTVSGADQGRERIETGQYGVTEGYEAYLRRILDYHEHESPLAHIRKYELVVGDACQTLPRYLKENPETIVALAYFDFDLYEPTKVCLEALRPHITRGTVLGFDELNSRVFPGETEAVREVLGLDRYRIQRNAFNPMPSYIVVD